MCLIRIKIIIKASASIVARGGFRYLFILFSLALFKQPVDVCGREHIFLVAELAADLGLLVLLELFEFISAHAYQRAGDALARAVAAVFRLRRVEHIELESGEHGAADGLGGEPLVEHCCHRLDVADALLDLVYNRVVGGRKQLD